MDFLCRARDHYRRGAFFDVEHDMPYFIDPGHVSPLREWDVAAFSRTLTLPGSRLQVQWFHDVGDFPGIMQELLAVRRGHLLGEDLQAVAVGVPPCPDDHLDKREYTLSYAL